jgi:hypothetical protein
MSDQGLALPDFVGDLGNGLVRRWTTAADVEKVALLMGTVHRDETDPLPNPGPMAEVRMMMSPTFPYMTPGDAAVVEDSSQPNRPLVACTYFWRHTWSYAGIPFGVTRPEMVVTLPAHRRRGLVRALFDMIHARSAAEGHLLQAITGIAYFYRQFGYDYALDLDGGRIAFVSRIPEKVGEGQEACALRLATQDDVPALVAIYNQRRSTSLVWHEAPEAHWRYEIGVWDNPAIQGQPITQNGIKGRYWVILDAERNVRGYTWLPTRRSGHRLPIYELEFAHGTNIASLLPSLLRRLCEHGLELPTMKPDLPPFTEIGFWLGGAHPLFDALGNALAPLVEPTYAWYVRVPDVPAFIRRIAPILEARLSRSYLAGYTGRPRIDLYRDGLELRFERGTLLAVEVLSGTLDEEDESRALACPPLNFPQLLLGYRSLDELRAIFPDVWVKDDQRYLVNTLFPKQHSFVDPLG